MFNGKPIDFLDRKTKGSSPVGRIIFLLLRSIDPCIQYLLLVTYGQQIISSCGLVAHPPSHTTVFFLLFITSASAAKQIINITYIMEEKISFTIAIIAPLSATIFNSLASLSSVYFLPSVMIQSIGMILFLIGITIELLSELQRKRFKDNPANRGRNYAGGLFSLARHINYGCYAVWRTGLFLVSGNYYLTILLFLLQIRDFTARAIPALDAHCSEKYGDSWKKYKQDVPYVLYPYIW